MHEVADRPVRVADEIILLHWWRMARWFGNLRLVPQRREFHARPLSRFLRFVFIDHYTRTGKIIAVCSVLIFLSSYGASSDFLLITSAIGIGLLLWSAFLGFLYRPKVSVRRDTSLYGKVGEETQSSIVIRNTGNRDLHNFAVRELLVASGQWPTEWLRQHQVFLETNHETVVNVSFTPKKRGVMSLTGIGVQSYFPFFLTRHTKRIACPAEFYVLPATLQAGVPSLRQVTEKAAKQLSMGANNTRKGPSLDYTYSRPFQTGDSLRRIDHRASSRLGEPMSKIFEGVEEIRRDQVHVIVDLSLLDFQLWQRRPESPEVIDERLALAVEIGFSAQNEGLSLAALSLGDTWHEINDIGEYNRHLACCQAQKWDEVKGSSLPQKTLDDDGVYILVTGRWSDDAKQLYDRLHRGGILIVVFLIAEYPDAGEDFPEGGQFIEISPQQNDEKSERKSKQK